MGGLRFEKYHGLGNDFLIALTDEQPDGATASSWARNLCRRRHGVGADGMILATAEPVAMRLWNSDGSPAEVSGNGLRCLAHAVARRRGAARLDVVVSTASGPRSCRVAPARAGDGARSEHRTAAAHGAIRLADAVVVAEMGVIGVGDDGPRLLPGSPDPVELVEGGVCVRRWGTADAGNPHVVMLVDDPGSVPLDVAGPAVEAVFPSGANVHFAAVDGESGAGRAAIAMMTWERGAGVTEACGTGAVSAAALLRSWGLVGDSVTVRMPGGDAEVALEPRVTLTGPSSYVAAIAVDRL